MPNWCVNTLTITGCFTDLLIFRDQAAGVNPNCDQSDDSVEPTALCFDKLYPAPDDVDSCTMMWGCKWDAEDIVVELIREPEGQGRLEYRFDTPWTPPIPLLIKVSADYPALVFQLVYRECGMAFAGLLIVRRGRVATDIQGKFDMGALIDPFED